MILHVGTSYDDYMASPEGYEDSILIGKGGNDILRGTYGENILIAGAGNDFLYGYEGNDVLAGGSGNDYLSGGLNDDFLFGGSGADEFVFYSNTGSDVIMDFDVEEDTLTINSSAELVVTEENGNAVIDFGGVFEGQVTLVGVEPSQVEAYFA